MVRGMQKLQKWMAIVFQTRWAWEPKKHTGHTHTHSPMSNVRLTPRAKSVIWVKKQLGRRDTSFRASRQGFKTQIGVSELQDFKVPRTEIRVSELQDFKASRHRDTRFRASRLQAQIRASYFYSAGGLVARSNGKQKPKQEINGAQIIQPWHQVTSVAATKTATKTEPKRTFKT